MVEMLDRRAKAFVALAAAAYALLAVSYLSIADLADYGSAGLLLTGAYLAAIAGLVALPSRNWALATYAMLLVLLTVELLMQPLPTAGL